MLLFMPGIRAAAITEYYLPPGSTQPYGVTFAPSGTSYDVWFAEFGSSRIGRKTTGNSWADVLEFQLATGSKPIGIAFQTENTPLSADHCVWFTESSRNRIGLISGTDPYYLTEYVLMDGADPHGITIESSYVWFTEYGRYAIAKLNPSSRTVTEYRLPDTNARPEGIIYLPASGIWFTEFFGDRIGFMTTSGSLLKEWPLPSGSFPHSLANDTFGNIWFTESGRNRIGRLNPYTNEITEYLIPTSNAQPFGIEVDSRNNVWITEHGTGKIGRFRPGVNTFVEFSRPGGSAYDIQAAADGKLWFSDDTSHRIGRIDPDVATTSVTLPTISTVQPWSTTATTLGTSTATTISFRSASMSIILGGTNITTTATTSTTSYSASETSTFVRTSSLAVATSYVTQSLPTTLTSTSYVSTTTGTTSVTATVISTSYQTLTLTTTSTYTSYIATTTSTQTITSTTTVTTTTYTFSLGADVGAGRSLALAAQLPLLGLTMVGIGGIGWRVHSKLRTAIRKMRWKMIVAALLLIAVAFTTILPSRGAAFTEWNLQYGSTAPYGLAFDDQTPPNLWFTEFGSDKIGRLNPSTSEIREIMLSPNSRPWDIAFETARKEFWFTESGRNIIGRITSSGTGSVSEFSLTTMFGGPSYAEGPRGLTVQEHVNGTDKPYIWVAEYGANAILRLDPYSDTPKGMRWYIPTTGSGPQSIVFSNEIGVWFTEYASGKIGNLNPTTGTIREWQVAADSRPWDLAIDAENNVWYTDPGRNKITKLNPYNGEVIEYLVPSSASQPYGIVIDSHGWIWFAEHGLNRIGRFVPDDGTFTEYARVTGVSVWGLAHSPGSDILWFGDDAANRLGRFDSTVAITTTTTDIISTASTSRTTFSITTMNVATPSPVTAATNYGDGSTTITHATTTSKTSYQVTETATVLATTSTGTTTVYTTETLGVLGTSTSYYSSTVGTQTTTTSTTLTFTQTVGATVSGTSTSIATVTTTSTATNTVSTGFVPGGIPGFPIESIIVGIGLAAAFLGALSRIKRRTVRNP
jgi:virginiamycin B lyase